MVKINIHIANDYNFMDNRVCKIINLPCLPTKGDIIYLSEESQKELEELVKSDLGIARDYAPKWFYLESYDCQIPKNENLDDLKFDDYHYVSSISFREGNDFFDIELDDCDPLPTNS